MRAVVVMAGMTVVALSAVGCAEAGGGGAADALCAYRVDYDDRQYGDVSNIDFQRGGKLGTAVEPPCDDTPSDGDDGSPAREVTAYRVKGLDPEVAIAVGDGPDDLLLVAVRRNGELPREVEKLRQAATDECVGTRPAPTASGTDDNPDDTPLYRTLAHIDRLAAKRYAGSFTGLSVDQDDTAADLYRIPSAAFDKAVCDAAEQGITVRIHDTDVDREDLDALAARISEDMSRWDGTFELREVAVDERGWVHVGVDEPGTAEPLIKDAFGTEYIKVVHVGQAEAN
ncbi:DUF6281 family protein [Streptomyces sp. YS415]|uniref:DUF6281 family protein n=1 Tax=Streptomyces sp. YS415 TaxID=2944806 RepID=UPI00202114A9|nr:DUF6281 family protein [Streptomyces sp. YS415]MCL7424120.1 DUF6281 family protein [Streptomyces sp. YS415]